MTTDPARILLCKAVTAEVFGISVSMIDGPSREHRIVEARQAAMWLLRHVTASGYRRVAHAFNRDKATVIHACRVVNERMNADPEFAVRMGRMIEALAVLQGSENA